MDTIKSGSCRLLQASIPVQVFRSGPATGCWTGEHVGNVVPKLIELRDAVLPACSSGMVQPVLLEADIPHGEAIKMVLGGNSVPFMLEHDAVFDPRQITSLVHGAVAGRIAKATPYAWFTHEHSLILFPATYGDGKVSLVAVKGIKKVTFYHLPFDDRTPCGKGSIICIKTPLVG